MSDLFFNNILMALNAIDFKAALSRFASGITVITTRDDGGRDLGMTATSFASVSLEPPLVLTSIDHAATMAEPLARSDHYAIHILGVGQEDVSHAFARKESTDKFNGFAVERSKHGVPLLTRYLARLECRVYARHLAGDHTVIIGEVLESSVGDDVGPLLYYRSRYGQFHP